MASDSVLELSTSTRPGGVSDDDEEDIEETIAERIWGLTEMFPDNIQKLFSKFSTLSLKAVKVGYSFSRSALWIAASSATIMVLPVVFESERAQQQEQQLQQQRQILLGPNAAVSGTGGGGNLLPGMGMMPPGMGK